MPDESDIGVEIYLARSSLKKKGVHRDNLGVIR
jgi:hypothetical protein